MKQKLLSFYKFLKRKWRNKNVKIITFSLLLLIIIIVLISSCNRKVKLTCADAEKIALEKIEKGTVTKCELNNKKYEVDIAYENYEYEFLINANTGEIIEYEADTID